MSKKRIIAKAVAATLVVTGLTIGSVAGPASAAKRDTGWGHVGVSVQDGPQLAKRDTGWGPV